MFKKIILCCATMALSASAFATTLSEATLNTCKDYINNPSPAAAKTEATALGTCYENNVCQNQLSDIPNCTRNLRLWNLNFSPASTTASQTAPIEQPQQPNTPSSIPTLFHSTSPVSATPTTEATPVEQTNTVRAATPSAPVAPAPAQTAPTQQNEKKPSINWF